MNSFITIGAALRSVACSLQEMYSQKQKECVYFRVNFMNDSNFPVQIVKQWRLRLGGVGKLTATVAIKSGEMDYTATQSGFRQRKLRT